MQRSKASVRVEVKQVIGALCRLLAATGLDPVPTPENFRRAKFGGGLEVEDQFWQLLAKILQPSSTVSWEASVQLGGAVDYRKLVAAGLWQTGYHADWMYGRQGGEGEEGGEGGRCSSRDLLLALGWLLATGKLEKLLTQRVQQLDQTLLTPTPVDTQLSSELQLDSASLRKLQWLIGCLRYQGRTLLSMQEERTRLLHAVFFASLPSSVSLSSSDQSSTVLRKDCVCMQQLCDLLEAYLNWRQVEKVFWTWMDSVVDCHLTDPVVKRPTHSPNKGARVCHHGNRGLEKLEDMLLKLPTGQDAQRRGGGDLEDREEGRERLHGGSDACCPPLLSSLPCLASQPQVYRAKLQTEKPVRHSRLPGEGAYGGAENPGEVPASRAVQQLLQTEALLVERRDRQRLANRMQLQKMIGRLDQLMLIPP
ncbi:tubulin epsilon and delta complex protein 1 isoform X2 [Etheostoma cragini]|uniref:tubulin epsilon and delta complex protein 1 isoform X2 n=1 Tax=Etheostoma cragini TaxID=417921 RepID=UPI00155EA8DC|nr:tubulin epsilon and delta complex protein 1 isoform X2 [Etheostoma cragini]